MSQEADQYINNIRTKYGAFELAETRIRFDPALYNIYIQNLISAVRKSPSPNGANNLDGSEASTSKNTPTINRSAEAEPSKSFENPIEMPEAINSRQFESILEADANDCMSIDDLIEPIVEESLASAKYEASISIDDHPDVVDGNIAEQFRDNDYDVEVESCEYDVHAMESSFKHWSKGFLSICRRNDRLIEELKNKLESADETIEKLSKENEELKVESENQVEALKVAHDQEMTQLKEEHGRMIERHKTALEQCKRNCSQRIEEAKSNKYCMCCDKPTSLGIYICSKECQKQHW